MGKNKKEHRQRVQARNARLKSEMNKKTKQYKAWADEVKRLQEQGMKEYQLAQLIQKNIDDVRSKTPEYLIVQEDGTFQYNTELIAINEADEVVIKASGIPVFETYSDKKITSKQYLEIIKDLTEYENTQKEEIPEIVIDEPLRNLPDNDVVVIQGVDKEELAQ